MAAISAAELDATWRQLERVPRPDLARALARAQELGAAAFKRKDFQGAYDHYNQAVTGLEYLARTGADATERDAVRALANRSACKLGRGDAAGAARDAAECARREPAWPKAWYRLGRALFAQDKFGDASQAFDEGARLEPDNAEFGRWRERCRAREEAAAAERRRARRHETDYSRFDFVNDGDGGGGGGGGGRRGPARSGAPVVETVEEMHDLMQRKQQAQIDQQAPADIYYVQTMLRLPQATRPAELEGRTALAAVVAYLERASALAAPRRPARNPRPPTREWSRRRVGRPRRFRRAGAAARRAAEAWGGAIERVRRRLGEADLGDAAWLHVGAGCGRSLARCARAAAGPVRALAVGPAAGARDVLAANGLADAVEWVEAPVEEVFDAAPPAVVVVLDPDLFDGGLLGRRALPYVRHARRHLAVPECVVVPARARVFCAPLAARLPASHGVPLAALDRYRWGPGSEELDLDGSMQARAGAYRLLAPPVPCAELDFCAADVEAALAAREARLAFEAGEDGVLNGVAFWFELDLVDELRFGTAPGGGRRQRVQWVDPVRVAKGAPIRVAARVTETRVAFEVTAPQRVAPVVHRHCLGRWHLDMVADARRNAAFRAGIRAAVASVLEGKRTGPQRPGAAAGCAVLDFGTGSGLLALYACEAGATAVVGVDTSAHVLACAREIARATPHAAAVRFVHKDCRRLEAGRDFGDRADVLVMELFDYGLLGEGCLHFARHAWAHCLRADARMVPRGAALRAVLVELGEAETGDGLDVRCLGTRRFQPDYYGLRLEEEAHRRLSAPFDVFDFDFSRASALADGYLEGAWRGDVEVTATGRLNAVVFWHVLDLGDGADLATGPDDAETCWLQACQPLEEVSVAQGTRLALQATHQGSRCTFSVDRARGAAARTGVEFYDHNDLALHNELAAQSAQLEKTVVFSSEARQEAADAALGVAVDPARLGRGGRYVDPDVAQQFAWTFFQG